MEGYVVLSSVVLIPSEPRESLRLAALLLPAMAAAAAASATTTTTTTTLVVVEASSDDRQPEVLYCKEGRKEVRNKVQTNNEEQEQE
jgi:hypothetical protein